MPVYRGSRYSLLNRRTVASVYDTNAEVIFRSFTTAPDATRKGHINTLVLALKTAGAWQLIDALYVTAAATAQAARINWKSPGNFTLVEVNSPTFEADRGYTGDGSTNYLDSEWDPVNNAGVYAQDSAHMGGYALTTDALAGYDFGTGTSSRTRIRSRSGASGGASINGTAVAGGTGTTTFPAHYMGMRRDASNILIWIKGVLNNTVANASAALVSTDFNLLRANNTFSARQIAAWHWGGALDDTQAAAVATALHTYMVAVGADT